MANNSLNKKYKENLLATHYKDEHDGEAQNEIITETHDNREGAYDTGMGLGLKSCTDLGSKTHIKGSKS